MRYIILLHGFGSNTMLMQPIERYLNIYHSSYIVLNNHFNSLFSTIPNIIQSLYKKLIKQLVEPSEIIFIGHSLGGIIALELSELFHFSNCKIECITLGTPYKGAYLANFFTQKLPFLPKISPILKNLSRQGNFTPSITNIPHHIVIGERRLNYKNPISWVTFIILRRYDSHDGVVELEKKDFDHIHNKQLYYVDIDHIDMIFNVTIFNLISSILQNNVEHNIKTDI